MTAGGIKIFIVLMNQRGLQLKKAFIKIAVVCTCVLAATFFSPDYERMFSGYSPEALDRFISYLISHIGRYYPGVPINKGMIFAIPMWIIIILSLLKTVDWLSTKRFRRKKEVKPRDLKKTEPGEESFSEGEEFDASKGGDFNKEILVQFFLKLFKIQIGASKSSPGKYSPVTTINVWPNRVYELSVFHSGDWVSRRLTIGPLGDDGVSKSVCYYVIYDDHLVVKVPPEPITDFQEYLACIKADMRIARKIAPKECIIPRVSVVLGRLLSPGMKNSETQNLEKNYVERLNSNSQFQEYLKIGRSFVFFMDLARYYFLSSVVNEMHDMENAMPREILGFPNMIWDTYEFEGRYGHHNSHIGFEMRNIYEEYEREIGRLLLQYGVTTPLPSYTMKHWFLVHLSGRGRIESEGDLSQSFIEDLNALSRESMIDNKTSIESYRRVVREYIYKSTIARFKAEMGSIVTNIIGLLIYLGKKQVSMRDLKPDNLIIAGDVDRYPVFLRSPDQFTMGFIDVETAVDYSPENIAEIMQPQLGGTPKYATPSHLFPNQWIIEIFGDLKRILHLQDWYASVAMIFKVITGGNLFDKTAALLPDIKRVLEGPMETDDNVRSTVEYVSRMFWKNSTEEFQEKIQKNKSVLNTVNLIVREKDRQVFLHQLSHEKKNLSVRLAAKINNQSLFKSKQNKEFLFNAPVEQIAAMRRKCESGSGEKLNNKQEIIQFFKEFEPLKIQMEQRKSALDYLKTSGPEIPVATMMEVMFNIVLTAMFTEVWGDHTAGSAGGVQDSDQGTSHDITL